MRLQGTQYRLPEIRKNVPLVGDLDGLRCPLTRPIRIDRRTITTNKFHFGMGTEPSCNALRRTVREHVHRPPGFQVDDNGAVVLSFAQRVELSRPVTEPARLQNRA